MISDVFAEDLLKYAKEHNHCDSYFPYGKKITLQQIFKDNWEAFHSDPQIVKQGIRPVVEDNVLKMIQCGTHEAGFEVYECPKCNNFTVVHFTCKSRFCPSCGVKYAKQRAANISSTCLPVKHRHVVFTIDNRLRDYFIQNRELLSILFEAVEDTLFYVFKNIGRKSENLTPGIIMTLHTFGRDLKWNPHIHCLVTEGGITSSKTYKEVRYVDYKSLRHSFMFTLLKKMKTIINTPSFNKLVSQLYKEHDNGFYVYAPPVKDKNQDALIQYIVRYTGRPVMAQSRIIAYDKKTKLVTYWYQPHENEEETIIVTEHAFLFMKKLIIHIPEEQFKMVRYAGAYAAKRKPIRDLIHKAKKIKSCISSKCSYFRRSLISSFNIDPLKCKCGCIMEFVDAWFPPPKGVPV